MIITVDLGNTRAKFGFFSAPDQAFPKPENVFIDRPGDFESLKNWLTELALADGVPVRWVLARTGVFPWETLRQNLRHERPADRFEEIAYREIPIVPEVEFPEKVGIDRLLAAYAASRWMGLEENASRFDHPSRILVVDAGTATTVDLVSTNGTFEGGAIFPGLNAMAESLAAISPRLPRIPAETVSFAVFPGKNTEEALSAGMYWGTIGAVRQFYEIVLSALSDMPASAHVPIILAGGDAAHLYNGLALFIDPKLLVVLPELVLSGIALTAYQSGKS